MKKSVIVYSTETCGFCKRLKKFLDANNVVYENVNLTRDRDRIPELKEKSNQGGVPVTLIDDEVIIGFDKEKISKLLEI